MTMKKEYITPSSRVIRLRYEGVVATSDPTKLNGFEEGDGLSNKNTSSMIWGEEE